MFLLTKRLTGRYYSYVDANFVGLNECVQRSGGYGIPSGSRKK